MKTIGKSLALGGLLLGLGAARTLALAAPGQVAPTTTTAATGAPCGMGAAMIGNPAARLSSWNTELGIRPNQQAAWDGYAKAVTVLATSMQAARVSMTSGTMSDATVMQNFAKLHTQNFTAVQRAAQTLLARLDPTQAGKARTLLPGLATPRFAMMQAMMTGGGMMGGGKMGGGMMGAGMMGGAAAGGGMAGHHGSTGGGGMAAHHS